MPYQLINTCLQDDMYGFSKTSEEDIVTYFNNLEAINRNSGGTSRKMTSELSAIMKKKHDDILNGKGLDSPKFKPYRPLGTMKTVFNLKVARGTARRWPITAVSVTPPPEPERPPTPKLVSRKLGIPTRRIGPGYTPGKNAN